MSATRGYEQGVEFPQKFVGSPTSFDKSGPLSSLNSALNAVFIEIAK